VPLDASQIRKFLKGFGFRGLLLDLAADCDVVPTDLESRRACGPAAKFVAVELACRLTGMTQPELALPFLGANPAFYG